MHGSGTAYTFKTNRRSRTKTHPLRLSRRVFDLVDKNAFPMGGTSKQRVFGFQLYGLGISEQFTGPDRDGLVGNVCPWRRRTRKTLQQ